MNAKVDHLKLDIVTPHWAPFVGGAEVVAEETAYHLATRHIVTVHTADLSRRWRPGHEVLVCYDNGIRVVRYPTFGKIPLFKPDLREADIVHIHGFYRPLILLCLAIAHSPIVIQPHGGLTHLRIGQSAARRRMREVFDTKIFRVVASNVSGYVCASDSEVDRLVQMGANRVRFLTLPGPIRRGMAHDAELLTVQAQRDDRDQNLFVVISRVVPSKYIEHVILAMAKIPELRVVIVGALADRGYVDLLSRLAEDLGVGTRLRFQGEMGPQELEILLCRAVGTVLPSKNEGWPLSIAEAVLFGAIPISTESAARHVAQVMGLPLLYTWGDIEGLVRVINRVRLSIDLESAVSEAKEWVLNHLTPGVVGRKLEAFYYELRECK